MRKSMMRETGPLRKLIVSKERILRLHLLAVRAEYGQLFMTKMVVHSTLMMSLLSLVVHTDILQTIIKLVMRKQSIVF